MAGKGETVKYVIDADTSGFARGMGEAALESDIAGRKIDRNLSRTAKSSENNFRDIRKNAQTAASSIRNFGIAFQAFNTTSAIIGVTALAGALIELSGAVAAAGSTGAILPSLFAQGAAAVTTYKTGVAGLGDAFKAIQKNDPKAFKQSLASLGPAATQVAYAFGGLNKAFNGIRLNVQQALFAGLGNEMLRLGSAILPTINAGMQRVAQSMNSAFKQAAALADTPIFRGLLATIFADTARNIDILSGALGPLLSIFTNLYIVTRPYVTLLAQQFVNLTKNLSAYLASARGQAALTASIMQGLIAIKELGSLVGAVFGLLTSLFRVSVTSGTNLITTLTGIVHQMTNFVNSAKGQAQLTALFNFTSLAVQAVSQSIGRALSLFFDVIQIVNSLNPAVQSLIVNFLATSLTIRPLISYLSQLYLAFRVLIITAFNFVEQGIVLFTALGAVASIALVVAGAFIILGSIIRGPLGGALLFVGGLIAAYIALNYFLGSASAYTAGTFLYQGAAALQLTFTEAELAQMNVLLATTMYNSAVAAADAGVGMSFAARGAAFLQAALLPLIALAAGVFVILSLLGVLGGKSKQAGSAATGLGSSLGGLQKAMKGIGSTGGKASTGGLSALNDSLGNIGDTAEKTTGSLASFDKMNVLTDNSANGAGGIGGLPKLPNFDGKSLGAPTLDTGAFDKALDDMNKNFGGLSKQLGKPFANPFQSLADWINTHPWVVLGILVGVLAAIALVFIFIGVAALPVTLVIALIVLAIAAVIAIVIILYKNWDTVTKFIVDAWNWVYSIFQSVGMAIWGFFQKLGAAIGGFFYDAWQFIVSVWSAATGFFGTLFTAAWSAIVAVWNMVVGFFQNVWNGIMLVFAVVATFFGNAFTVAWNAIKTAFGAVGSFFSGVWTGIMNVFAGVVSWFGNVFTGAWNAVKNAFGAVGGFFQGIWNTIVSIFGSVGTAIGNAIGGAFKSVVNTVLNTVSGILNDVINLINGAIGLINHIPGVHIGTIGRITLPRLAKGGIVSSPTIAEIGENGQEAVMPLENNTGWIDQLANKINAANGNSSSAPLNVTVELDGTKLGQILIDRINEKTQMSGRNQVIV